MSRRRAARHWPRRCAAARWRRCAVALIGAGFLMMFQSFALALYTWSFVTILAGTAMFIVVSKFPE